ncbi:polysaccharide biosynthesis tyrosine autokinase [Bacteroidales bacterium OttesenSCG-928-I21]|nr:polysaccharide biosynthesis tyrosine autokinase [Bacteroidales bacterium OttesenSCG-928-I21]
MEENLEKEDTIDIQEILFKYLGYWKWFILSFIICMLSVYLYLRVTMQEYNVSTVIMINDEQKGGALISELSIFDGMGMFGNTSTENEIEVLKSKSLIRDVIKDLTLYVNYIGKDFLKKTVLYGDLSPVAADVSLLRADELTYSLKIELEGVTHNSSDISVTLTEDDNVLSSNSFSCFPILLETPYGKIILKGREAQKFGMKEEEEDYSKIMIIISNPVATAREYLGNLTVAATSKNSSVVQLSLKNTSKKRGVDFLNKLIEKYNTTAVEDKNKIAQNTAEFIEERLVKISAELGSTEKEIESYKKTEGLTEIRANSELSLREGSEYERKRVENETQLNLVRSLKEYVSSPSNKQTVIPANIGLTDAGLVSQINKYNELLLERNRLLSSTSESNPVIINQNLLINSLFENIQTLIKNVEGSLLIAKANIDKQAGKFRQQIGEIPTQERIYVEIDRQRQIQSALYLMLLQKREENALAMAATTNKAKIIDETLPDKDPVSPKKKLILLIALVFAVAIPVGIIFIKDFFTVKFSSKQDIEKERLTNVPILAEIPLKDKNTTKEDSEKTDSILSEAFRLLRTNVGFILDGPDKKVILVTSSIPGEGKTFVSINIAKSFALLNKKVLLIGMDIRNPQLANFLSVRNEKNGLTNYLAGNIDDLSGVIQKVQDSPNLDVILAGPVPPNPAELLSKENLDTAIENLKSLYDYIIIDSAPVGVVTDTLIIKRIADMTLYVCRANYTHKKSFETLNALKEENKLPNISLVVNAVEKIGGQYGQYGYGSYGK